MNIDKDEPFFYFGSLLFTRNGEYVMSTKQQPLTEKEKLWAHETINKSRLTW